MAGTAFLSGCQSARCRPQEAFVLAVRGRKTDGDSRWALPLAMAHWLEGSLLRCLGLSARAIGGPGFRLFWVYHNLVGMVARKLEGETDRAV